MLVEQSREIRLASYPEGLPRADDFCMETVPVKVPAKGEVQVRNTWMSVDPYMRGQMRGKDSYVPGFKLGQPLIGGAVGVVTASESTLFAEGDTVLSHLGWREAFNAPAAQLTKVDATKLSPETYLGAAGLTGLTAWAGVLKIAEIKQGDVLFVSAAAGATGSVACQIAKLKGAFVIGSAGGHAKCEFLRQIGVDATIDYKNTGDFLADLERSAPSGLDVYFDNVGGKQLEAALQVAKPHARFALCGRISTYNEPAYNNDPAQDFSQSGLAKRKQISVKGFLVTDYFNMMPSFLSDMTDWIQSGHVVSKQTVEIGLDHAVAAFLKLFSGENLGKMLVRLAD